MIGIQVSFFVAADVLFTSSAALATVGLTSPIAALQKQKFRAWIPITTGATGGVRVQVVVPAGGSVYHASIRLNNTVTPLITPASQNASAVFTNALANAATHWLEVEGYVVNGATAGNIDIQLAQNTSDALSLTVLQGGSMEVTKF